MPTEGIFNDDATFDGNQQQSRRRTLTKVEKENAEHFAEWRRRFEKRHHGSKEQRE